MITLMVHREKLDARRCGLATGPGPAWKWGYRVERNGVEIVGLGYTLAALRSFTATRMRGSAEEVEMVEQWEGGRRFVLSPRGAWRPRGEKS